MLTALRHSNQRLVRASESSKEDGPFLCPECREVVLLNRGAVNTPHFAHKSYSPCGNGPAESDTHRRMKIEIYDALTRNPLVTLAELERPFGEVRADVFAVIDGVSVAIEVQISTLSADRIAARTRAYARLGVAVLWLLAWSPDVESLTYAPQQFERWLHAAYFGRVYYWHHGLTVIPYQFHDRHLRIPAKSWYDARGKLQRSASRTQISTKYKVTVRGKPLNIVSDFRRSRRLPWEGKFFRVPEALLYIDKRRNFERG